MPRFEEPSYVAGEIAHVEAFDLAREVPEAMAGGQPGVGPNVWPDAALGGDFRRVVYDEVRRAHRRASLLPAPWLSRDD